MNSAAPVYMPQWEWRTFAPLSEAQRKSLLGPSVVNKASAHETSILCANSKHDVLIRGEVIRLKWRKQVNSGGLELWDLVLSATFPFPAEVVLRLFQAWVLPVPNLARSNYSKAQFLEEILPQYLDLTPVDLEKRTEAFQLNGITCGLTRLTANHIELESFCIEHEDPALVLQVLHHLGLQGRRNTSYPQGLKAALNLPTQH
ncbi:MAG: hypothetical protein NTW40_05965 [Acidobacteria bacterium]|nr:hypothetical protein [Acidobacteriota bacterium]